MRILLFFLLPVVLLAACQSSSTDSKIATFEAQVDSLEAEIESLQTEMAYQPGFVHSVFFWLKDETDREAFEAELKKLTDIETIRKAHIGPPAGTPRGVVDNSYHYALLIEFDDAAGHDTYQEHPVHLAFVDANGDKWNKVVVYDTEL